MTAKDALIRYNYRLGEDGKYRCYHPVTGKLRRTQIWQPVDGGWLRFEFGERGEDEPEAYRVADAFSGVSGLDKVRHPEAFEWVYPEAEVLKIYKDAVEAAEAWLAAAVARKKAAAEA